MSADRFSFKNLLSGLSICLLGTVFLYAGIIAILIKTIIPAYTKIHFPMQKNLSGFLTLLTQNENLLSIVSTVMLLLSLVMLIVVVILLFTSNLKFRMLIFVFLPINLLLSALILLNLTLSAKTNIAYYQSGSEDVLLGITLFILHYVALTFLPIAMVFMSLYICLSKLELKVRLKFNIAISVIFFSILILSVLINFIFASTTNINLTEIKGLDLNLKNENKEYIIVTNEGEVLKRELTGYYETPSGKIPYSKHNFEILSNYAQKVTNGNVRYLIADYLKSYYQYNFELKEIDKLLIKNCQENKQNFLLYIASLGGSKLNHVSAEPETLNYIESIYYDKDNISSDEAKCLLSIVQYKNNKPEKAKENCTYIEDSMFCGICSQIISGEVKLTTFKGKLLINYKPAKHYPIAIQKISTKIENTFGYLTYIDFTYTDDEGSFVLKALTSKETGLVIFTDNDNTVEFDYSKMKDYKQGSVIDLGDVVVNSDSQ